MIELYRFFFILILGTLSHFFYEWSDHNKVCALFFAVNESTWEHIKLILGPTFLLIIIEIPFIGLSSNFLFSKLISLLVMMIFIPTFYYIYVAIFKKSIFILNILEFVIAIALGQFFSYRVYNFMKIPSSTNYISIPLILIIFILYMIFTYYPLKNFLFRDPVNKKYGINAHMDFNKKNSILLVLFLFYSY